MSIMMDMGDKETYTYDDLRTWASKKEKKKVEKAEVIRKVERPVVVETQEAPVSPIATSHECDLKEVQEFRLIESRAEFKVIKILPIHMEGLDFFFVVFDNFQASFYQNDGGVKFVQDFEMNQDLEIKTKQKFLKKEKFIPRFRLSCRVVNVEDFINSVGINNHILNKFPKRTSIGNF